MKINHIKKKDVIVIVGLLATIFFGTYIWTNHHLEVKKKWWYVQYPFIKRTIQCSERAPSFMYDLMGYTVLNQKSMSNQLVYLTPEGTVYHCESGWEDGFLGEVPVTENSRFLYASVSKVVTAAMVLDLVNQRKIKLDQKLVDIIHIPELKDQRIKNITVRMLLEHSAGFDRFKTYTPMLTRGKKPWCPTNIEYLSRVTLDFEPNTQFQYSNVGYCLLGAITEQVTGQPFREAVEARYHIAKRDIRFIDQNILPDEIQYDHRNEIVYGKDWRKDFDFKDSLSAVGGLSGSAKQMALLAKHMLAEKPLNILSRSEQPCAINLSEGCYGFAMEPYQRKRSDFTVYNKSGYFPGVETDIFVDDLGGVLTIFRGATTPARSSLADFRKHIYDQLVTYYSVK